MLVKMSRDGAAASRRRGEEQGRRAERCPRQRLRPAPASGKSFAARWRPRGAGSGMRVVSTPQAL